jgi:tetratricopeptide (TPR) repeat protein
MLGMGWLTLRQANEALRTGRLEDAYQLLSQPAIQGHKKAWELMHQLMLAFIERGEKFLRQDDPASAWNDLLKAEQIGITDNAPLRLRQALTRLGLAEARALLDAGEPVRAVETIAQLRNRAVRYPDMDALEEGAKDWVLAREYMEKGEFAQALEAVTRAARLLPQHAKAVAKFRQTLEQRNAEFAPLLVDMHQAAQNEHWQEVLRLSEKLLAQAPKHAEIRRLRTRAWKAIEPATAVHVPAAAAAPKAPPPPPGAEKLSRFILWIDGVGGFLVCLENRVTLGQAGPDNPAEIPLHADVSRMHASLTRDTEGYVIEALRPVRVNLETVEKKLLQSGQRLTLGPTCQLLFCQDVPISASARLDVVSGHRFGLAVDGAVLMAETLVLGPSGQVHIAIPALKKPVILYRNKDSIGVRSTEKLWMNGQTLHERGILEPGCTISGGEFSLALEPLSKPVGKA